MHRVLITTTTFGKEDRSPLDLCKEKKLKIMLNPYKRRIKPNELIKLGRGVIGIIAGTELMTEETLSRLPNLKVISRCGAGLDNIDMEAAKRLGIRVFNTADAATSAVAELTVGLMINLLKKVNQMDAALRKGRWEKMTGNLLYGKKVGIIGFGRIGRRVAELLKPFSCELAYADPFIKRSLVGIEPLSLQKLLKWAEIISIHASGKETLLGKDEFRLIKRGAWLINTSRGKMVDERALYQALKKGHLSGAALDVFQEEPYKGRLKSLKNVILTPHIGSYAKEARVKIEKGAVLNLLKGLGGIR